MEMVKNMVYAGVGLASMTSEKVKETIDELVEKGRISDTEGKRIVQEFFSSTEKRREDFESKFKMATEKVTEKFDFLTKEKEIQALNDKIQSLEIELAKAKKAASKTTANKTTANKTTTKSKTRTQTTK